MYTSPYVRFAHTAKWPHDLLGADSGPCCTECIFRLHLARAYASLDIKPEPGDRQLAQVQKMAWWYWSFIDWMIANPAANIKDAAPLYNVTPQCLYIIKNSDAFKRHFDNRVKEISQGLNVEVVGAFSGLAEKTAALAELTLDALSEKVQSQGKDMLTAELTSVAELTLKKLGYGAPETPGAPLTSVTVNVVQANADALAKARQRLEKRVPLQLEAKPLVVTGDANG